MSAAAAAAAARVPVPPRPLEASMASSMTAMECAATTPSSWSSHNSELPASRGGWREPGRADRARDPEDGDEDGEEEDDDGDACGEDDDEDEDEDDGEEVETADPLPAANIVAGKHLIRRTAQLCNW